MAGKGQGSDGSDGVMSLLGDDGAGGVCVQTQHLGRTCFIYIFVDFTSHDLRTIHALSSMKNLLSSLRSGSSTSSRFVFPRVTHFQSRILKPFQQPSRAPSPICRKRGPRLVRKGGYQGRRADLRHSAPTHHVPLCLSGDLNRSKERRIGKLDESY